MNVWKPETEEELIINMKRDYNKLVARQKKAEKYLDDGSIPIREREEHIPLFLDIIRQLDEIFNSLKSMNVSCTDNEILEGFELKERDTKAYE